MSVNPYKLDWGEVFVESYNTNTKNATVIYNFNFDKDDILVDIFAYSIAHIFWVYSNLPPKSSITAIYDLRGRSITKLGLKEFENKLLDQLRKIKGSMKINLVFHQ